MYEQCARYGGTKRNPYNEYECGHWYGRALSSYALLQAYSGIRYDAVEKKLVIQPPAKGDVACFIATATGFGLAGVRKGKPFVQTASGHIAVDSIVCRPPS